MSYLAGLDRAEATRRRAEERAMARDHGAAMRSWNVLGAHDAERRSAWQGGEWKTVSRLDTGAEGAAARLMLGGVSDAVAARPGASGEPAAGAVPVQTPLARSQALIDASAATRATLEALLTALPSPQAEKPN